MPKLPATEYPALQKFVMKGVSTKAAARDTVEELQELISALQEKHDDLDEAVCMWEDEDDSETRAEGRARLEELVTEIDEPLAQAGYCAGQKPYDPEA